MFLTTVKNVKMQNKTSKQNIPDGWTQHSLGDLGNAIIGLTYSPNDVVEEGGTIVFRSSNVQRGKIHYGDLVRVGSEVPKKLMLKAGDILICARNGSRSLIGKNALIRNSDEGATFGAFMSVYRTSSSSYMYQLFQSELFKKEITKDLGPTINQVTTGNLLKFRFNFPPDNERKNITELLNVWDEAIQKLEHTIVLKREIKRGLMQKLLTGRLRLSGFKEEWVSEKLSNFTCVQSGDGFPIRLQGHSKGKYPFIKVSDMNLPANSKKIVVANNYVDEQQVKEIRGKVFEKGSIVFPKIGAAIATNKKRILTRETLIDNNVAVLVPNIENCNSSFLYHWLLQLDLMDWANSGGVPSIRKSAIEFHPVVFPSLEEQEAIGSVLDTFDDELELLQKKKLIFIEQKKYLLSNLLSGQIRTPENL